MCRAPMPRPSGSLRIVSVGVDRLPVHQRLAHAHEDDVRDVDRRIEQAHLAHLTGDLERREVAREAHRAGRAERALQRASGLRRDAERHAIALGNRDASRWLRRRAGGRETSPCRPTTFAAPRSRAAAARTSPPATRGAPSGSSVISSKLGAGFSQSRRAICAARYSGSPARSRNAASCVCAAAGERFSKFTRDSTAESTGRSSSNRPRHEELIARAEARGAVLAADRHDVGRVAKTDAESQTTLLVAEGGRPIEPAGGVRTSGSPRS